MTISVQVTYVEYNGDGSNQIFNFSSSGEGIYFEETSEVVVHLIEAGVWTLQVEGIDYEVSDSYTDDADITFYVAPTADQIVRADRVTQVIQDLTLSNAGAYNPTQVMNALDKGTRIAQEQATRLSTIEDQEFYQLTETAAPDTPESGKVTIYADTDGYVHALDDEGNDVNLTTHAEEAEASAQAAAASELAAATSESNASVSEDNADTSEQNAAASEAAAAASQALAETAATAAAAASETLAWGYAFNSDTANSDPGSGQFKFNNVLFSAATEMYISETSDEGDISATMAVWDASSSAIKATVRVRNPLDKTKWAEFYVSGLITDNGSYRTVPIQPIAINDNDTVVTTWADGTDLLLGVWRCTAMAGRSARSRMLPAAATSTG